MEKSEREGEQSSDLNKRYNNKSTKKIKNSRKKMKIAVCKQYGRW